MTTNMWTTGSRRLGAAMASILVAALWLAPAGWADEPKGPECAPPPTCDCEPYPCCECSTPKPPPCPPKYDNRRFVENWRPCLCKDCCDWDDGSDKFKARRLTRDGFVWVNVGGQIRFRWESFGNIGFGAPADDNDAWMLMRTRAHADVHFGEHVRVFLEGIYADQWENRELGPRPIDRNRGDLLNAFGEVSGALASGTVGAWVGRRELQTVKQRLVSPLDWANTRRTFQGAGAWWKSGAHKVEAWWTNPVVIDHDAFDDVNDNVSFWGVDYTNTSLTCLSWGAYGYGLNVDAAAAAMDEDRITAGAWVDGKIPSTRFDYDVEVAYQFGDFGAGNISAFMASATFGWKPCASCGDPRIAIGLDYASGDDNPADTDNGTFNQLFPLGHKYLGHADLIGRQNLVAARLEASYKPAEKLTLSASYHLFWRAEEADAVYSATGGVLRAPGGNTDTQIGSELDLMLQYAIDRHWVAFAEYARFFAGDFLKNTGASEDVQVWFLGVQGTF